MTAPGKACNTGPKPRGWARHFRNALMARLCKIKPKAYQDDKTNRVYDGESPNKVIGYGSTKCRALEEALKNSITP